MSYDINFLPKELQPKKKADKKPKPKIELSSVEFKASLPKFDEKKKGGFLSSLFSKKNKVDNGEKFASSASGRIRRDKEDEKLNLSKEKKELWQQIKKDKSHELVPVIKHVEPEHKPEPKLEVKIAPKAEFKPEPLPENKVVQPEPKKIEKKIKEEIKTELKHVDDKRDKEIELIKPPSDKEKKKKFSFGALWHKILSLFKKKKQAPAQSGQSETELPERKSEKDKMGLLAKIEDNKKDKKLFGIKSRFSALKTNLIKGQGVIFFEWRKYAFSFGASFIFSCLLIGAVYFWLSKQEAVSETVSLISSWEEKISKKKEEVTKLEEKLQELSKLSVKAKQVKLLLDKHIYWTNFFKYLEKNTLDGVYYAGFDGDLLGSYTLSAHAKNFNTFINQMNAWQNEKEFTKLAITKGYQVGADVGEDGQNTGQHPISFAIELEVDPKVFYK